MPDPTIERINAITRQQNAQENERNTLSYNTTIDSLLWSMRQGSVGDYPRFERGFPFPADKWIEVPDPEDPMGVLLKRVQVNIPCCPPRISWNNGGFGKVNDGFIVK